MSSSLPTLRFPPPLGGKIIRDPTLIPPEMVADAENFYSREQTVQVRPGLTALGQDLDQRITGILQYPDLGLVHRVVLGTTVGWWTYNISTGQWDDITGTPLTAANYTLQNFRAFQKAGESWLLGVNGTDTPKVWDGVTATFADMGGTPPIARTIMTLANRVILGYLTSGGTVSPVAIDVSAFNNFNSGWGSVLVALLADTPGDIVAMRETSALTGAIWKQDALYLVTAQGASTPFSFSLRAEGIAGPASSQAVVSVQNGAQIYLANDFSVKVFDGAGVSHLPSSGFDIQRHIAGTANSLEMRLSFGYLDKHRNILWFYYPGIGQTACGRAVAIDLSSYAFWPMRWTDLTFTAGLQAEVGSGFTIGELMGTIGSFDPGLTIGDFATSIPRVIACEAGGQAFVDFGLTDAGTSIPFYLETGLVSNTPTATTVSVAEHLFHTPATAQEVTIKVGVSEAGETPTFDAGETIDLTTPGPRLSQHRQTGKLFAMRLEGEATNAVIWRGAAVAYATRGRR